MGGKSTHGTYLNGEKLGRNNRKELKHGDELRLTPLNVVAQEGPSKIGIWSILPDLNTYSIHFQATQKISQGR